MKPLPCVLPAGELSVFPPCFPCLRYKQFAGAGCVPAKRPLHEGTRAPGLSKASHPWPATLGRVLCQLVSGGESTVGWSGVMPLHALCSLGRLQRGASGCRVTPGGKRASLWLCDQTQAHPSSGTGSMRPGAADPPLAFLGASPLPPN